MFKFKHRVSAFLLSAFVVFGTVSSQYLTVQAFEWVEPTLYMPFEGALPYLLGLLGIAPSTDTSIDWDSWRDDYENSVINGDLEISQEQLDDWINEVSNGKLNQVSDCWLAFKNWAFEKFSISSGDYIGNLFPSSEFAYTIDYNGFYNTSISSSSVVVGAYNTNNKLVRLDIYNNCYINSFTLNSNNYLTLNIVSNNSICDVYFTNQASQNRYLKKTSYSNGYNYSYVLTYNSNYKYKVYPFSGSIPSSSSEVIAWDLFTSDSLIYDSTLIDKLSFVLSNSISSAIPDVIPLPWDEIGDTVDDITDTIDGLIEQVNSGVISISAYMQAILDLVGAIAVDTTTDLVYPQNPDKPDETIDDKTDANKENQGFTLLGLEKVFPFCIPFDIYAFMTLLVAEPVAPVINWPVYNPITQENEIITIDFSTWDSVVILFRYIFDFLFIIGLLLMARALIGGGDSA